ncbi:MAG: hypothetical protein JWN48_5251 [Myxococcaceae bacterium]|nr:hypothetical protein [Myxococcaceae bacterium]
MRPIPLAALLGLSLASLFGSVHLAAADEAKPPRVQRAPDAKRPPPPDEIKDSPVVQNPNDCAVAKASARYVGYGYTHVISAVNGCSRAVECTLWTDVDPEPRTTVNLGPGDTTEVVTRRGSPSREVTAFKQCSFR